MPILTFRYSGEILSKQRPRAAVRGRRAHVYNPPKYSSWLQDKTLETTEFNQDNIQGIRVDLLLYEFGLTDFGLDPDNTEGSIQDAITKAHVFFSDTFLTIPIHTTACFPVAAGKEFIQATICYQGTEQCYERYFTYRNKRELLSLKLMKVYRKDHLLKGS
jgi:Holliday junction resolvase RusA-like endonuclease